MSGTVENVCRWTYLCCYVLTATRKKMKADFSSFCVATGQMFCTVGPKWLSFSPQPCTCLPSPATRGCFLGILNFLERTQMRQPVSLK